MGNPATLQPKPFTSEHQPARKGRKPGALGRAAVFKKWLAMKIEIDNPHDVSEKLKVTMYEAAALGQMAAAAEGNTAAWKEIQDTLHGKIVDKSEVEVSGTVATFQITTKPLTDDSD